MEKYKKNNKNKNEIPDETKYSITAEIVNSFFKFSASARVCFILDLFVIFYRYLCIIKSPFIQHIIENLEYLKVIPYFIFIEEGI